MVMTRGVRFSCLNTSCSRSSESPLHSNTFLNPTYAVADLKDRASKAKNYGANKITATRDRYSSQPSKNINWDVNHKRPPPPPPGHVRNKSSYNPPPPPSRTSSDASHARSESELQPISPAPILSPSPRPPPIIRRVTRPDSTSPRTPAQSPAIRSVSEEGKIDRIDWGNLPSEDKLVLFSWLDEFFAKHFNVPVPPRSGQGTVKVVKEASLSPAPSPAPQGPPKIPMWSRPSYTAPPPTSPDNDIFTMSYPRPNEHGSLAADLAYYFAPSTHWDSAWYAGPNPLQPPLFPGPNMCPIVGWMQTYGASKTVYGSQFFEDLSMCWWSVEFPEHNQHDPNDNRLVKRIAQYLPRPAPIDRAALVDAHETYGETVAAFAESFDGTGEYCARGESWDLANEALKYFEQFDYVPKPVPSTWRTHGHLIFEGKASNKGRVQQGRWRGGDDRVRRGDIVEWRSVKLGLAGGATAHLGDPDHTAVIVSDAIPSVQVADGQSIKPAELGTLEVMHQSVGTGKAPHRTTHELSRLEEGEMWIYRPVGMLAYVGCFFEAQCPDGVNAMTL
ncbi:hypothetical protein AcW1_002133 [Taiwanofungus camphoratus]|nr:hypothetical protein AcV5_010129 [Antrodia cinnamomea]KAI0944417.1 hypothetical protein AcW1_002133 [Antrodia cinnamomea]